MSMARDDLFFLGGGLFPNLCSCAFGFVCLFYKIKTPIINQQTKGWQLLKKESKGDRYKQKTMAPCNPLDKAAQDLRAMHKRKLLSVPDRCEGIRGKRLRRSISQPSLPAQKNPSPKAESIFFSGMRFLLIKKGIGNVQFEILATRIKEKGSFALCIMSKLKSKCLWIVWHRRASGDQLVAELHQHHNHH